MYELASIEQKNVYAVRLFGSILFIIAITCIYYYRLNVRNFRDAPEL